jgi:hypothetical protein
MTSTMLECLQGIQMAKEATAPDKNRSGNPANNDELLTRGSLMTDGRITQNFQKEKMRSNNSNDGNYLLLWGILSKL